MNDKAYLCIVDVVDFIKDHKFDISYQIGTFVEHTSQDLGRHLPRQLLLHDQDHYPGSRSSSFLRR